MTMTRFTRSASGWNVLSRALLCVAIGLSALSVTSCRSLRSSASCAQQVDSLEAVTELVTLRTVSTPVRGDTVSLAIPLTSLRKLPPGAEYSAKRGRTRVSVGVLPGDTLSIHAETDSVCREIVAAERFTHRSSRIRHEESETSEKERRWAVGPGRKALVLPSILFIAGVAIMLWSLWKLKK